MNYGRHSERYHGELVGLCSSCVEEERKYVVAAGHQRDVLDDKNSLRLVALCAYSIPTFRYAINVSEPVFACVHRTVIRWVEKNLNHYTYLSAVGMGLTME